MADTAENLIAYLLADATIAALVDDRIWQNVIDVNNPGLPYVWLRRRGIDDLDLLGGAEGGDTPDLPPYVEWFDLEAVSNDQSEACDLAAACTARINTIRFVTMGDRLYQWGRAADQSDDYIPRNVSDEDNLAVEAVDVEITNT